MTPIPSTGIAMVDRELERRAPFDSSEEAEVMAIQLLRIWRALQPGAMGNTIVLRSRQRKRERT